MDISKLDTPEVRSFIHQHENDEVNDLVLKAGIWPDLPIKLIAQQIQSRKKAKKKLPTWYANERVIFPPSNLLEQSSSEATAKFKASIIRGDSLLDLTGGTGVDSFYLSDGFNQVTVVEPNSDLVSLAQHNFSQLGKQHVTFINSTAEEFLATNDENFDVIYIDPSRKDAARKLVMIEDCQPNLLLLWRDVLQRSNRIYLKLSPLLDINRAVSQLTDVARIWIVAVTNDCKELVFEAVENASPPEVNAVNIVGEKRQTFSFPVSEESQAQPTYGEPGKYLYEPNAAVMKSGAFKLVSQRFGLLKLAANTHLYTSQELRSHFPGKVFLISDWSKFEWKSLKKMESHKLNIVARNFPHSVAQIRQKSGIEEGGDDFIFFTRLGQSELIQINCQRIQDQAVLSAAK